MIRSLEQEMDPIILTTMVSTIKFWLMYDIKWQTEKTKETIKEMKKTWPKGYIDLFKDKALKTIPTEFYRNNNIETVLVH